MRSSSFQAHLAFLAAVTIAGCAASTPPREAVVVPPKSVLALEPITPPAMLDYIRASESRVIILNIWATWCEPCKEELPDFLRLANAFRQQGVELVLYSADFDGQRQEAMHFLQASGVDFKTYFRTGGDQQLIDTFHREWSGALPATFIYSRPGKLEKFLEGRVTSQVLEREVSRVLETAP